MRKLIGLLLLFFGIAFAQTNVVNLYTWSNYFPESVLKEFTFKTGIQVNVTTFDSNEELYTKLRTLDDASSYDVIVPSSYFIGRLAKAGLLHVLEKANLEHMNDVDKFFLNNNYDKDNQYSIPFIWGATGIVVNTKYHQPVEHWSDLWNGKFRNQILLLNDVREVFAISYLSENQYINQINHKMIKAAYKRLVELMPNVKLFNVNALQPIYEDEDATIGMGWNSDIYEAMQDNPQLKFIYPDEGFSLWVDVLAIPKSAPHFSQAIKFMNYMTQPKILAEIAQISKVAITSKKARALLPDKVKNSSILYPSRSVMRRAKMIEDVGDSTQFYMDYWELLKIES